MSESSEPNVCKYFDFTEIIELMQSTDLDQYGKYEMPLFCYDDTFMGFNWKLDLFGKKNIILDYLLSLSELKHEEQDAKLEVEKVEYLYKVGFNHDVRKKVLKYLIE